MGTIILLNCGNKSIEDMNIDGIPCSINIHHSSDISIEDNKFENIAEGICIANSDNLGIHRNSFENFGIGLEVIDSGNVRIANNSLKRGMTGIYSRMDNSAMDDNFLEDVDEGINVDGSNNFVNRNSVIGGYLGISVSSPNSKIHKNTIDSCNEIGLEVKMENSTVTQNFFLSNKIGILLCQESTALIEENVISGNIIGIRSESKTGQLEIRSNNISDNEGYGIDLDIDQIKGDSIYLNVFQFNNNDGVQVRDNGKESTWDNGEGMGNYWSDYKERYSPTSYK